MYSAFYNIKMKYDESDNIAVRASRVVTDRIGDTFGQYNVLVAQH